MNWADVNWLHFGYLIWAVTWGLFLYFASRRRWTWLGLFVGVANMMLVSLNAAAPLRGVLDPGYAGYQFLLISVPQGIGVTLVAGSMVLLSLSCALVAVGNRIGRPMLLLAAWNGLIALLVGVPLLYELFIDFTSFTIQLGEYVTIPWYLAFPIIPGVLVVPFALAAPWAYQRSKLKEAV